MAERGRPAVYSIPAHRSFADALADGLIRQHGRAPDALARGRILLPTNRAVRTLPELSPTATHPRRRPNAAPAAGSPKR